MKTNLEEISPVMKKLVVEIEPEEVEKKLNRAYEEIGKKAKIRGFRSGKVPRNILETYYGNQVADDVTRELISDTFPKAVDEANTFPLGQPVFEKETIKKGKSFQYSVVMEVRPQLEIRNHLGVEVKKEILSVTEDDVLKRLEFVRKASGKMTSIDEDRPIRDGDYVIIDYEGFEDGRPLEGIKSPNLLINIGKMDFHPKFDEDLIGLKKEDEKEISADFDGNHSNAKLAGKSVTFRVKVVDIKELEIPELNDEFAQSLGADLKDLEALKNDVRKSIIAEEERRIDRELKQRLIETISEDVDCELPQVMVDAEVDFSVSTVKANLERSGSSLENQGLSEEGLKKELRPASERRVKDMLILSEIAKRDKITVTEDDLEDGYGNLAERTGQDLETLKRYYEAKGNVDSLKEQLLEDKSLNYLVAHANVSEVTREALNQEKIAEQEEQQASC